jgi:hypothetical protein
MHGFLLAHRKSSPDTVLTQCLDFENPGTSVHGVLDLFLQDAGFNALAVLQA